MIYMEPQSLGWRPVFKSWLNTLPKTFNDLHKTVLTDMFERFVDACLQMVRRKLKELAPTNDINLVKALMNLIDCQIDEFLDEAKVAHLEDRIVVSWLEVRITVGIS